MTWQERVLDYAALVVLVLVALVVAFCLDEAAGLRARLWSVRTHWTDAAEDVATTCTVHGRTVTVTSTRETAARLLRDTIGEL